MMKVSAADLTVSLTLLTLLTYAQPNSAVEILEFTPGSGASTGYDQPSSLLGEPSRLTPGEFGGPVDPFSPPWQSSQLLSLGAGGSVTVRFDLPVQNHPSHPYGLDFLLFGSAGFLIINGDFTGGGITDGSLFGAQEGQTRVSVSSDGLTFFALDAALAPTFDALYPTDGLGNFTLPVNPTLTEADFEGLDITGIRALYGGSGGGVGFDLDWARDGDGLPVPLESIQYVRLEVLSGRAELDALVAVPEPSAVALGALGLALLVLRPTRR